MPLGWFVSVEDEIDVFEVDGHECFRYVPCLDHLPKDIIHKSLQRVAPKFVTLDPH